MKPSGMLLYATTALAAVLAASTPVSVTGDSVLSAVDGLDEILSAVNEGEYPVALERLTKLQSTLSATGDTQAELLNTLGVVQMRYGFKLLDQARATLERAAAEHPDNKHVKKNLRELSEFLDEPSPDSSRRLDEKADGAKSKSKSPNVRVGGGNDEVETDSAEDENTGTAYLRQYLNPWVFDKTVKRKAQRAFGMQRPFQIMHVFRRSFAVKLHDEIFNTDYWHHRNGSTPFYQFDLNSIYDSDPEFVNMPHLATARRVLANPILMEWMADVGAAEVTDLTFGASLYKPGQHTQAHTDVHEADGQKRRVAIVLHMTRQWKPNWGGDLVFFRPTAHILPSFNAMTIFPVSQGSWHMVTPVSHQATYPKFKRLAISGWYMTRHLAEAAMLEELGAHADIKRGYFVVNGQTGGDLVQASRMSSAGIPLETLWREPLSTQRRRRRRRKGARRRPRNKGRRRGGHASGRDGGPEQEL